MGGSCLRSVGSKNLVRAESKQLVGVTQFNLFVTSSPNSLFMTFFQTSGKRKLALYTIYVVGLSSCMNLRMITRQSLIPLPLLLLNSHVTQPLPKVTTKHAGNFC